MTGSGKVFKCLYRHKFENDMSEDCREKLALRQKLMQENYKVKSKGNLRTQNYHVEPELWHI